MVESSDPLLEVEQALRIVLAQAVPLAPLWCSLSAARGHILAAAVTAAQPLPPFPASVKDGYAVVAADGPGDYPVIGAVTAGRVAEFTLTPGTVAYITTGAPLPAGADAVVMVEETEALLGERSVRVRARVVSGADVRPIGYDLAAGQEVLEAGTRLGAAEIGLLATLGISTVLVYPQPRVAILSTGDELVAAGARLGPGQIYDSNRPALAAAVEAAGGVVVDLGMVGDTRAALTEAVERGVEEADLLLTSGGVSLGEL
ncbi:MAG: molybdopterin molybdotransferase MoeA, partial [Caldilinea sp.]